MLKINNKKKEISISNLLLTLFYQFLKDVEMDYTFLYIYKNV